MKHKNNLLYNVVSINQNDVNELQSLLLKRKLLIDFK